MKIVADFKRQTQQQGAINRVPVLLIAAAAMFLGLSAQHVFFDDSPTRITMTDGKHITWRTNQWTVINYFAEWCAPCLRELPELNAFAKRGTARVLGVSYDNLPHDALIALIQRHAILFPVVHSDDVENLPVPMPTVLPTTYIIAPNGELIKTLHGEQTEAKLSDLLLSL